MGSKPVDMMDTLRKNDDCYFYYYSSCYKGESCPFRHEPSALGIETICSYWKQGKCFKQNCNFRHMEVRKNRNVIPCYWESQPGGCRKPHCPFQHKTTKDGVAVEGTAKDLILPLGASQDSPGTSSERDEASLPTPSPKVNPLVVNVEEESDSESVPSTTPVKRVVHVKTLEEIRLERIQAESAAYYHYDTSPQHDSPPESPQSGTDKHNSNGDHCDVKVLSLAEIRERKRKREEGEALREEAGRDVTPPPRNRKRCHSPVIFDISKKASKEGPCKPTVAVAARKRPHAEVESEDCDEKDAEDWCADKPPCQFDLACDPKSSLESENPNPVVKKRSWRSKQPKSDEECNSGPRKIKLRKGPSVPDPENPSEGDDKVILRDSVPNSHALKSSSDKITRTFLHISPESSVQGDLEADLSLLSPVEDPSLSLNISKGDILDDIDALLND